MKIFIQEILPVLTVHLQRCSCGQCLDDAGYATLYRAGYLCFCSLCLRLAGPATEWVPKWMKNRPFVSLILLLGPFWTLLLGGVPAISPAILLLGPFPGL